MMSGSAPLPSNSDKLTEPPLSPAQQTDYRVQELPSTTHAEYSPENTEQLALNLTGETFLKHRRQTSVFSLSTKAKATGSN
jgi:hypothetical protein